jgi:hypothetical protein
MANVKVKKDFNYYYSLRKAQQGQQPDLKVDNSEAEKLMQEFLKFLEMRKKGLLSFKPAEAGLPLPDSEVQNFNWTPQAEFANVEVEKSFLENEIDVSEEEVIKQFQKLSENSDEDYWYQKSENGIFI